MFCSHFCQPPLVEWVNNCLFLFQPFSPFHQFDPQKILPPSPLEWGMDPIFSPPPLQPPLDLEWFWYGWTFPPNCEPLFPLGEPFSSFSSNFILLWNGWN